MIGDPVRGGDRCWGAAQIKPVAGTVSGVSLLQLSLGRLGSKPGAGGNPMGGSDGVDVSHLALFCLGDYDAPLGRVRVERLGPNTF